MSTNKKRLKVFILCILFGIAILTYLAITAGSDAPPSGRDAYMKKRQAAIEQEEAERKALVKESLS